MVTAYDGFIIVQVMVLWLLSMRMEFGTAAIEEAMVGVDLEAEDGVSVAEEEEDIMDPIWTCSKMEATIMNHMLKEMVRTFPMYPFIYN